MLVDSERPVPNPLFFGRQKELDWLFDRSRRRGAPIVISGPGGVGKTTLLKQFLAGARTSRPPFAWTLRDHHDAAMPELIERIDELYRNREWPEIVAIDEAETLTDRDLNTIPDRLLNLKAIRTVIFASRRRPEISRAEVLDLGPLDTMNAEDMDRQEIDRLLKGEIYNLESGLVIPRKELITDIKPKIMLANQALVERLRKQPQSVFELPPRQFEELIAELLSDLGYEVELTPATRDGGKDILAYMSTPHGRVLCLVEAKKYRTDRLVGVELVRQLFGTLIDADASSAMLVTTSSFSPDAHSFQRRHQYKLALRDYGNIVQWIEAYGKK